MFTLYRKGFNAVSQSYTVLQCEQIFFAVMVSKNYSILNMRLIKTKDKSKHLSKEQRRRLQKVNFVGLMMRFSYFLNQ